MRPLPTRTAPVILSLPKDQLSPRARGAARITEKQAVSPHRKTTELSGLILLAALVFAPWCWGCTWPAGIHLLNLFLLSATFLWLIGNFREIACVPPMLRRAVIVILIEGWAMTLNSRSLWAAATGLFAPLEQSLPGLPGSLERDLSQEAMARLTGIVGAALIAAALGRSRRWRRRFCTTMVLTAVPLVLFGCLQRWTHASDIFWGTTRHLDYFFATYRNVTNAGEYLNLVTPLAAALALSTVIDRASPWKKAGAVSAWAILLAGSFVTGSKIAPLLAAGLAVLFLVLQSRQFHLIQTHTKLIPVTGLILVLAIALIVQGSGLDVAANRWHRLWHDADGGVTLTHRWSMDETCLAAAPQAGALGFGPGTFEAVLPSLPEKQPLPGIWLYAHQDYLQTWLEWGGIGAAAWSVYFFGALQTLARGLRRDCWPSADGAMAAGLLVALTGIALMALIDFPLQIASLQLDVAVAVGLGWSSSGWARVSGQRVFIPATFRGSPDNRVEVTPPAAAAGR